MGQREAVDNDIYGLQQFLTEYPGISIAPTRSYKTVLKGIFLFSAQPKDRVEITDFYHLQIIIPFGFPKEMPKVVEIDRKIPRDGKHHVNYDHTLCLGSPLRLRRNLSQHPSLIGFARYCLIPYLYAVSHKLMYGNFPFGELTHGEEGVIKDYLDLFCLKSREQVEKTLLLLGMKRRIANKEPCPCGCGLRLGVCAFHYKVNNFRKLAHRSWFKGHAINLGSKLQ